MTSARRSSFIIPRLSFFVVVAAAVAAGLVAPAVLHAQGRVEGQIRDGTLNQPVSSHEVRLLLPRAGMQHVATASTDAQGHFFFAQDQIDPRSFYLVSTEFQGVAYNAPAQFDSTGTAVVDLTVYDSTGSDSELRVQRLRMLARAEGGGIRVRQEYTIQNPSQPPRAYASPDGTFHFRLLPQVTEPSVAVTGLMNMQLPQTPEAGRLPGEFFIRYPLKPGLTVVTVDYETDYTSAGLALGGQVSYPVDHAEMYVSPSTLSVDAPMFKLAGVDSEHDVQRFDAGNLPGGAHVEAHLTGEAASGAPAEGGQGEDGVRIVPNSMTRLSTPLIACFLLVLLWALGVRVAKEWPKWTEQHPAGSVHKRFEAKVETLLNSVADLDELFAAGKIPERNYWKERLELKAKLVAILKKSPPASLESYAIRKISG